MLRKLLFLILVVAFAAQAQSVPQEIPPGEYIRERGSGSLTVRRDEKKLTFEIETIGGNGHICSVSGVIRGAIGHGDSWAADGSDSKCDISFTGDQSAVVVRPISHEECRAYCGARAMFDGTYRTLPTSCTYAGRKVQRDRFLVSYRARRYSEAVSTLQSLIAQCGEFMDWIEIDQVRNDLALSQYHKGEFSQCLATLGITLAADISDVEEFRGDKGSIYLPPSDFDSYRPLAKSILFNKALCTKAITKGR